ncbi:MAG: STAS/SEC14 domain-containing protein [Sulfuriferula sp.]|nr:STAS/SEC14 domain-containing protein [Sulfuriferula sp.]
MINISLDNNNLHASVLGEFTLADFQALESHIAYDVKFQGKVNLVIDLRDMLDFTVDVAWEELRFSREHAHEFNKIAIITSDIWLTWSAWLNRLFVDADIQVFETLELADAWIAA